MHVGDVNAARNWPPSRSSCRGAPRGTGRCHVGGGSSRPRTSAAVRSALLGIRAEHVGVDVVGLGHLQRDERVVTSPSGLAGETPTSVATPRPRAVPARAASRRPRGRVRGRRSWLRVRDMRSGAHEHHVAAARRCRRVDRGGSVGSGRGGGAGGREQRQARARGSRGSRTIGANATPPLVRSRPSVVFSPIRRRTAAGIRIDPPVSLPTASGTMPGGDRGGRIRPARTAGHAVEVPRVARRPAGRRAAW